MTHTYVVKPIPQDPPRGSSSSKPLRPTWNPQGPIWKNILRPGLRKVPCLSEGQGLEGLRLLHEIPGMDQVVPKNSPRKTWNVRGHSPAEFHGQSRGIPSSGGAFKWIPVRKNWVPGFGR